MPAFRKNVFSVNDVYKLAVNGEYDTFFNTGAEAPGVMFGWGRNAYGTLGLITDGIPRCTPIQLGGDKWTFTSSGTCHSLGKKSDGTLWAWGYNARGELGQNCLRSYSSPIQIPGTEWKCIRVSSYANFATKNDGTLWGWGSNYNGTLGDGCGVDICKSSPILIGAGGNNWKCIHVQHFTGLGTKNDGTLYAWGRGTSGQIGDGTCVNKSTPVQLQGCNWTSIASGCNFSSALKDDGTLWTWGDNGGGQLGLGDLIARFTPVQVPGGNWCTLASGFFQGHAIKGDGTLWSWGVNYSVGSGGGFLGDGTTITRCSPVQIPGNQWADICSHTFSSIALKTDGTLWVWGRGVCGQLGLGDTINRSSPTQIPGTWAAISSPGPVDMFAKKLS